MTINDATRAQIKAARPGHSTWLSANAGSGKTRVLTDRVARLLLEGVDPQNILCLTYTKAAAAEMQNRLFKRLGAWAMLESDALRGQLQELGVSHTLDDNALRDARKLFALAIETPGGLKIQTIHSFCSSLLRRFPLEAGITPQFTEMEERAAELLQSEIIEELAQGPHLNKLQALARHHTGESLAELTAEIVRHRAAFAEPISDEALEKHFGIPANLTLDDVAEEVFLGDERPLLDNTIIALRGSGKADQTAADKLAALSALDAKALPDLEDILLFKSGENAGCAKLPGISNRPFPTKTLRETDSYPVDAFDDLMRRVEVARPKRLAVNARTRTRALHDFAQVFLPAYAAAKQARGWLDFDDLILCARDLLTDRKMADWVLFKLDGGIDHILVDEAQDTSPVQWQVIERLAQEFTSGEGARDDLLRTIFVVGDKKQSIYSFQGADPREFDRMQSEFAQRLEDSQSPLVTTELQYSFRSSHAVLSLVDATFEGYEKSGFASEQGHKAFKSDMPGRVDLWPVIPKPEVEDVPDWHDPVDIQAPNDPSVLLAKDIAQSIKKMVDTGQPLPAEPEAGGPYRWRPVQPGDFLILVQRRGALFHDIIRECKAAELPVAGADRLKVGAELAVRDLAALLSFLATPEDDLSLATALRSPLFGWDEAQLYDLAHGREKRYLWAELRRRAEEFRDAHEQLQDLLREADFLRPYDLIERILTRHHGRYNLLSRLGAEAEDGIDALLSQAMAYEQQAVDSLTGFLTWLETDDLEIKRQMDNAENRIRVMTVHGAKGLEAPIVILPDCGKRTIQIRDNVITDGEFPIWRPAKDDATDMMLQATGRMKAAQEAERDRLLYVAMTRAEKWLIVAAAGDLGKNGDTWYDKVAQGMKAVEAQPHSFTYGGGLRLEYQCWPEGKGRAATNDNDTLPDLPDLFARPAPRVDPPPKTLSPSDLDGAKALPGEAGLDEEAAKQRGTLIHRLLEVLPQQPRGDWERIATHILGDVTEPSLIEEAIRVLDAADLAYIFRENGLNEVPVTANLSELGDRRIHGIIDRLIVSQDHVLAIDYKTNAVVPDTPQSCPDGILRQMGAYHAALQQLYPEREIRLAILWTRNATLMHLPHDLVTDTLASTQIS